MRMTPGFRPAPFGNTATKRISALLRTDRHIERADTLDLAFDLVAGNERADAGRRSGHDHVAGGELDHFRQFPDRLLDVPDHLVEIAFLLDRAVDLQRDAARGRMADL